MADAATGRLPGKTILVVEDDYILAMHVADTLRQEGATVIGPAGSVRQALRLLERSISLDAAVLDVNLGAERVYPVADALIARKVPLVFATGYEELLLERAYVGLPRCPKPIDGNALVATLQTLTG